MNAPARRQPKKKPPLFGPHPDTSERAVKIAWAMSGALLPATLMAIYYFGMPAVTVILACITTALVSEIGTQWAMKKPITILDGHAFLTGLLLGLCLPSKAPLFIPIIGSISAIVIAKHLLGVRGHNVFNPALFGMAVVFLCFPTLMAGFVTPSATLMVVDAKTTATPLALLKQEGMGKLLEVYHTKAALYVDLFLGNRPGALGETSVAALLLGGLFLLKRHSITWHIPCSFIAAVGVLAWVFGGKEGLMTGDPLFHMMSGGLVLGAFFLATDPATSPSARSAQLLFGIACGVLTALIRLKSGYPEGVMFAILIMNCFAPRLDQWTRGRISDVAKPMRAKKRNV